jgi:hypothetical protein
MLMTLCVGPAKLPRLMLKFMTAYPFATLEFAPDTRKPLHRLDTAALLIGCGDRI